MAIYRDILEIDEEKCDGCGVCVPACAEGALVVENGKIKVLADRLCDGLGACIGECPKGALSIIKRKADEFDEKAVESHLGQMKAEPESKPDPFTACPGSMARRLKPTKVSPNGETPSRPSALLNWPVKIRLVPPKAPYLQGADLLVLADCSAVAITNLHENWLARKVVLTGCPKFDHIQEHIDKFAEIFKENQIRSVTCVSMEVPCCSGLPFIVKKALEAAQKDVPLQEAIITREGEVRIDQMEKMA